MVAASTATQIVRCFRDEDLRADRQPEFTQIDLEMSFVGRDDVMGVGRADDRRSLHHGAGRVTPRPFPVLSHREAMQRFGSDRPDLRVDLELADFSTCFAGTEFRVFADALGAGHAIRGLAAPGGGAALSRRELDDLAASPPPRAHAGSPGSGSGRTAGSRPPRSSSPTASARG